MTAGYGSSSTSSAPKRSNVVKVLHWGEEPARIMCLIGSMRFQSDFASAARVFSLQGYLVLSSHVFTQQSGSISKDEADMLHEMTLKRIDMSDVVFVINPNNRVTETVQAEIDYAESLGRTIRYLEQPASK